MFGGYALFIMRIHVHLGIESRSVALKHTLNRFIKILIRQSLP